MSSVALDFRPTFFSTEIAAYNNAEEVADKIAKTTFELKEEETLFEGRFERSVQQMYDEDDLSSCCLFGGGFINFGYWASVPENREFTSDERVESQKAMYRYVASQLSISREHAILEVGSGLGVGAALIADELHPKQVMGIDFAEAQVKRALKINALAVKANSLTYQQGPAENIPLEAEKFDRVYSIEAAQHFESLEKFIQESHRVLKTGGKVAVASFFGTTEKSTLEVSKIVQTVRDGIDHLTPIENVKKMYINAGFSNVKVESIGNKVWEGFDKWVSQGDLRNSWTRNWFKGYQRELLDYYLISAEKL